MAYSAAYQLGRFYGRLSTFKRICLLTGIALLAAWGLRSTPAETVLVSAATVPSSANLNGYDPVAKWGSEKVQSAVKIMAAVNEDCRVYEEGFHLVVEMRHFINNSDQRLKYVRTIADTDAILHGKARSIYFVGPNGRQIAKADTLHGIRLTQ